MQQLVEQLAQQLGAGRRIYAHCWGGRGRAGTLGACLLGYIYGLSAEEALMRVQRAFDTRTEIGMSLTRDIWPMCDLTCCSLATASFET